MKGGILLKLKMAARRKELSRGQALVLTVLILAAILAIALAVTNIFIVEIRLAGDVGESVKAVMAADSGVEWALYRERKILPEDRTVNNPSFNKNACSGANCLLANGSTFEVSVSPSPAIPNSPLVFKAIGDYLKTRRSLLVTFIFPAY